MGFSYLNIFGLFAITGAILYAIGDVLLLAGKANLEGHPRLKKFEKLLSDTEKMADLSPTRLAWGALIGVFSTPLILLGIWQTYQGLNNDAVWINLTILGLFGCASIIGAFVHGSFYYLGEYVQALDKVDNDSQEVIAGMLERHKKILMITYVPLLIFIAIASILFSLQVGLGTTMFPVWMAAITPLTMTFAWLFTKRILPRFIQERTEGAGFNIAYIIFFICTTITLWR